MHSQGPAKRPSGQVGAEDCFFQKHSLVSESHCRSSNSAASLQRCKEGLEVYKRHTPPAQPDGQAKWLPGAVCNAFCASFKPRSLQCDRANRARHEKSEAEALSS